MLSFLNYQASDAYHFFTSGQTKIQQGLLREGYDLISEALNLLNNVYGALHPEIAACLRLLARLNYIMGEYGEVKNLWKISQNNLSRLLHSTLSSWLGFFMSFRLCLSNNVLF